MADIRLYLTLEKIPSNIEFWKARPSTALERSSTLLAR